MAIKAIERPQQRSGQSIIKDLLNCIDEIIDNHKHIHIEIMWISDHSDIQGNERVDAEAKKAAMSSALTQLRKYKPLNITFLYYNNFIKISRGNSGVDLKNCLYKG